MALNGGGRIFSRSPSSPFFPYCLLSCLVSCNTWETLSALLLKTSKLKNHGFDQLVSQRNWHHLLDEKHRFGGTKLPWRNVPRWLHDGRVGQMACRVFSGSFRGGHRRYLSIRNHDNRSSADWIRLCPGLSKKLRKREQLFKASQGCPSWLKQWEERSALRLRLLTAIWILSRKSSRLCKEKLTETRTDNKSSRGIGMRLLALRLNKHNLIFSGSLYQHWPWPRPLLGNQPWEAPQGDALCVPPPFLRHLLITHTHTYTHTDYKLLHIQTHPQNPRSPRLRRLNRQPDKRVWDQR